MSYPASFSRPLRKSSSIRKAHPATLAPVCSAIFAQAPIVPPVVATTLLDRWRELAGERERLDDRERVLAREALAKHKDVVARAAAELGVSRTSLLSRLRTLKIVDGGRDG